uniref:PDZ domain-containing protein n=2 Tax=Photinus pyralis TaxID=7054 RepID=A0A1Y1LUY4_PHOPY
MDIFMLLFLSMISIIIGIIVTLVVQYYVLIKYFDKNPTASPPKKPHAEVFSLPETLKKKLETDGQDSSDSSMAISLMLQFLFHELRHSDTVKRWLYKKLSLEFEELITKTTTGKFFDAVTIRDMNLGSQFPNVKSIGVESVKLDKNEGHIDTLNLCIKLDYSGNFLISVDAKMKFGKTAYLSIMVKQVSGLARLQFTRLPYTHWSFSFYGEPELELAVESHFQGRQLQSNVTNLIVNQIKKAIKRKHTLPNYKIRYKPFFIKADPGQLDVLEDSEIIPQGKFDVMCMEVSRLSIGVNDIAQVYCTFAVDSIPWVCLYQKENQFCMVLELTIRKSLQQQIGVTFRFDQNQIIVDSVTPQMAADRASLKVGDILLTVEGKSVTNITHLNKMLKLTPGNFSIRVERLCSGYQLKSRYFDKTEQKTPTSNVSSINEGDFIQTEQEDSFIMIEAKPKSFDASDLKTIRTAEKAKNDKAPLPKLISTSNENVSKFAQTIGNFSLRKRKPSIERTPPEGSTKSTPNISLPTTPQHSNPKHSTPVSLLSTKKQSILETSECEKEGSVESEPLVEYNEIHKGQTKDVVSVISYKDEYQFNLKETDKYLNVNVWGLTSEQKDILLGYMNISLGEVLNQCSNSMLGHYIRSFSFLPPTSTPPTR